VEVDAVRARAPARCTPPPRAPLTPHRFCEWPQEIVIQFPSVSDIKQIQVRARPPAGGALSAGSPCVRVQILSHEYMIAARIELLGPPRYAQCRGHV
jgi:hypothetical protein